MGIKHRTVTEVTCDICGKECGESDGVIRARVNNGDGRDVGPAYITGELRFSQPYGVSNGLVCPACMLKYLEIYVADLRKQIEGRLK